MDSSLYYRAYSPPQGSLQLRELQSVCGSWGQSPDRPLGGVSAFLLPSRGGSWHGSSAPPRARGRGPVLSAQGGGGASRARAGGRGRGRCSKERVGIRQRGLVERSGGARGGQQRLRQAPGGRRREGAGVGEDADRGREGHAGRHAAEREGQGGTEGHGAKGRPDRPTGRQAQRWRSCAHLVQSLPALLAPAERVGGGWSAETCGTRVGWGTWSGPRGHSPKWGGG